MDYGFTLRENISRIKVSVLSYKVIISHLQLSVFSHSKLFIKITKLLFENYKFSHRLFEYSNNLKDLVEN